MVLRSLLRRIPGHLLSPSGRRMVPVHGVTSPAAARLMGTQPQGVPRTIAEAEKMMDRMWKSREVQHQKDMNELKMSQKHAEAWEDFMNRQADFAKTITYAKRVNAALDVTIVALLALLVCASEYQA